VSPRAVPLTKEAIVHTNSDEHDEQGFTSEDPIVTMTMMDKRMRKLETIVKEIEERNIETVRLYGSEEAEATIVSCGGTKGLIREAMKLLGQEGFTVNYLQLIYLHPFPKKKVDDILKKAKKTIVVEHNKTGQLAGLIRERLLRKADHKILKYDGRPFNPHFLAKRIKEVL